MATPLEETVVRRDVVPGLACRTARMAVLLLALGTGACSAPQPPACDGQHREAVNAAERAWR